VSAFGLFWGIFGDSITGGKMFEGGEITAFVVQGVLLTFSAVMLLSQMQENLAAVLRRAAGGALALRLGTAYPLARRFRTGLTLGMYSLVLFTMVFIAVLSTVFGGQVDTTTAKAAGGFDMFLTANSSDPPSAREVAAHDGVAHVAPVLYTKALFQPPVLAEPEPWPVTGIDERFIEVEPPVLSERAEGFETDAQVFQALVDDPTTAVVDAFFLQSEGGPPALLVEPGEAIAVIDPLTGARTERTVIGVIDTDVAFAGVLMSRRSVKEALSQAPPARFYVTVDDGQDPIRLAASLQGGFFENGLDAKTFRGEVEVFARGNLQFMRLMQGYLALGLVVGIAGLGVIMVRAVRERRHEVGVLRSLGFVSRQVRRAFLLESGFIAIEGILVGTILGLITARQLVSTGEFGEGIVFEVPWGQVGVLMAVALVFSLLATAWPAEQAARIPPAVALRTGE